MPTSATSRSGGCSRGAPDTSGDISGSSTRSQDCKDARMKEITKRYSNGEITVVWQPHLCIHSANCARGLPQVFDPRRRPWIDPRAATSAEIVAQVGRCPSGALSIETAPSDDQLRAAGKGKSQA